MPRLLPRPRSRDERGAVAVMVAILAMVLLGVGAFAVDMGQVYAKRAALQSSVDLAALAAAAELDGTNTCTSEAVSAAEDYLTAAANEVQPQAPVDLGGFPRDGDGFIGCTGWRVRLWAPDARVDFGIAKALSPANTGVDVPAYAEAAVYSPLSAIFPGYVVPGCDYGPQTMTDPPGGSDTDYVPSTLAESTSPDNSVSLTSLVPEQIDVNQASSLTINGSGLTGVTWVSFATEDGQIEKYQVGTGPPTITVTASTIQISEIPAAVRSVEKAWWVRVSKATTAPVTQWSNPDGGALPLRVGQALLDCEGAGNEGRFGRLDLPPSLEGNLVRDVGFGMTIGAGGGTCSPGSGGAVAPPTDGTNCVRAEPAFPGDAATSGLITGVGGAPGRLDAAATTPGCDGSGGSTEATVTVGTTSYSVNNDTLTCFFEDLLTDIDAVSSPLFGGRPVVSLDILDSPRFFWVPVLSTVPGGGGSYWVTDFRVGFITGEIGISSKGHPDFDGITQNGLGFGANGIETLKLVLVNPAALPESAAGRPTMSYLGVGPKITVLVD